jgi:GntR family transcriptional regulator
VAGVPRSLPRIDTRDPRPIWRQVEEGVAELVASGAFAPGEPGPSVRELAQRLRINPATVAKAFQRLVDRGVLESRRGDGTYVAEGPPTLGAAERRERLVQAATRLAVAGETLGADEVEAHTALDEALRRLRRGEAQGRKEKS